MHSTLSFPVQTEGSSPVGPALKVTRMRLTPPLLPYITRLPGRADGHLINLSEYKNQQLFPAVPVLADQHSNG